jgi:hypothetical protein
VGHLEAAVAMDCAQPCVLHARIFPARADLHNSIAYLTHIAPNGKKVTRCQLLR